MLRNRITSTLPVLAAALMIAGVAGCKSDSSTDIPLTESDAARMEAENLREKQAMLEQGEQLVRDGEAERARGQAMIDQGNTIEGEPMVAAGNAKIAQGQAIIDRANEMETAVEPIQVDVQRNN